MKIACQANKCQSAYPPRFHDIVLLLFKSRRSKIFNCNFNQYKAFYKIFDALYADITSFDAVSDKVLQS